MTFYYYGHVAQYRAGIKAGRNLRIGEIPDKDKAIYVEGFRIDKIAKVLKCPWERQYHIDPESKSKGAAKTIEWENECFKLSRSIYSGISGPSY
jgi:hypothetical protein